MGIDINIRITGGAGQGVHTAGALISRMAVAAGYHFHATQDYMSRIRGGRNSYSVRMMDVPARAGRADADILLALDPGHLPHFLPGLHPNGLALSDLTDVGETERVTAAPLKELAVSAGSPILGNMAGAGIVAHALGVSPQRMDQLLALEFRGDFLEKNRKALRLGADWASGRLTGAFRLPPAPFRPRMLLAGNEALALGAVAGGCKFAAGYPMTPGSGILLGLSSDGPPLGLVFEQAEDEIAALNMAIGASYAGARSMVATSGGGFALMAEALSLAGMLETPVVIAIGMRPGPATGMPTRTGQEDLEFALSAGHGEFPRVVLAPGSVEEAYALAFHAMETAEAHQVPVHPPHGPVPRGHGRGHRPGGPSRPPRPPSGRPRRGGAEKRGRKVPPVRAHGKRCLADGRSGEPGITVVADSDEHDEDGHLTEDHGIRVRMEEKRARKEEGLAAETLPPLLSGPPDGEAVLVGFGSTKGVIAEAREILARDGVSVAAVHLRQVWPFPTGAIEGILSRYGTALTVENNRRGQLARLIRRETGRQVAGTVSRCDGLPFTPEALAREVKERIWAERSTRR